MRVFYPVSWHSLRLIAALAVLATAFAALSLSTSASAAPPRENPAVLPISPKTTEAPDGKIEVIEFFSYLCPHCAEYNPQVEAWKKKLPADVVFLKIPVSWGRATWGAMARAYYALEAVGEEGRLTPAVFDALHKEHIKLTDKTTFLDWAGKQGVDAKKLEDVYDSFAVNSKVMYADKKTESYKVQGVPRFYVNGRYDINTDVIGSVSQVLSTVDEVIVRVRKENGKK